MIPLPRKRRALILWTMFIFLAWLSSRELLGCVDLIGAGRLLLTPPWPHLAESAGTSLLSIVGAGAVFLAGIGAGRVLLSFFRRRRTDAVVTVAAGFPLLALAAQGAGVAGLLQRGTLVAVVVAGGALSVPAIRGFFARRRTDGDAPFLLRSASFTAAAAVGIAALAPEAAWDAMVYHLRVPSLYMQAHRIYPVPEIFPSFFPFTGETLMMLARAIGGDSAARLLHVLAWLAGGLGVARLAGNVWGTSTSSRWALALYLTVPLGMAIASRAYVEFFLVLPLVAGLLVLTPPPGSRVPSSADFALAGWLGGAAFGVKYLGGFATAAIGAVALAKARRPPGWFAAAPGAAAAAAAAGGFWLARNLLWTGNPVYPLVFGGPRWTPADMAGWADDAMALRFDPAVLLTAPWNLMSSPGGDGGISPLLLAGAAVPLLWASARGTLWALSLALLLVWWVTAPLPRYLTPALAVLCAAAGGVVDGYGLGPSGRRWAARLALLAVWGSLACGVKAIQFGTNSYSPVAGKSSRQEYRAAFLRPPDYFAALAGIERLAPPAGRAYVLGHSFCYDLKRRAWFDTIYTRPALYWLLDGAGNAERVRIRARQANLTHIAWHPPGTEAIFGGRPRLMSWTDDRLGVYAEFWRRHVRPVSRLDNWVIHEVTRHPLPASRRPPELPGTEGITRPVTEALRRGEFPEALKLAREARLRYPSHPRLPELIRKARLKRQP